MPRKPLPVPEIGDLIKFGVGTLWLLITDVTINRNKTLDGIYPHNTLLLAGVNIRNRQSIEDLQWSYTMCPATTIVRDGEFIVWEGKPERKYV